MKAPLVASLRAPRFTHVSHPKILDGIRGLMQLLQDAGFASRSFDANDILERDLDEVIAADRSQRAELAQLASNYDSATRVIKPLDEDPMEYDSSHQAITPTAGTLKSDHTRSLQYASVTSDPGPGESWGIQRMSLGPLGASMIRDRNTPAEARSANLPKLHPGQLHIIL